MQQVLTFTVGKTKYVSKTFDFETMCIIDDAISGGKGKGALTICRDAVDYMFEGTDATQDVINSLNVGVRARLCVELWGFYVDAMQSKNG